MASGIVRKAMVYLGLTDDEYEDYEGYDDGGSAPPRRYPEPAESARRVRSPRSVRSAETRPIRPTASR